MKYREAGSRMESSGTRLWHERHRHHWALTSHSNLGGSGGDEGHAGMFISLDFSLLWEVRAAAGRGYPEIILAKGQ